MHLFQEKLLIDYASQFTNLNVIRVTSAYEMDQRIIIHFEYELPEQTRSHQIHVSTLDIVSFVYSKINK